MSPEREFLDLACLTYRGDDSSARRERAEVLVRSHPELARNSVFAAAALADLACLRSHLKDAPELALARGGPRDWPPLLYLCYARVAFPGADALGCLELLLECGADPGAAFDLDGYGFTALTGVMGEGEQGPACCPPHPEAPRLAARLLAAGALANDSQGLYNTMFSEGDGWLRMLLRHGLSAADPIGWDMGLEPRPRTLDFLLSHAVDKGRRERVELLLSHGADPSARNPYNGRSLVFNARFAGRGELAELLLRAGASAPELAARQRFQLACVAGDPQAARGELTAGGVELQDTELLTSAAALGQVQVLELLGALGADLDRPDSGGATPLHHAALHGRVAALRLLLDRGADRNRRDRRYRATPLGWAEHAGHTAAAELLR